MRWRPALAVSTSADRVGVAVRPGGAWSNTSFSGAPLQPIDNVSSLLTTSVIGTMLHKSPEMAQAALQSAYAEGLAAYRERRWDEAGAAFARALEAVPGDGPAKALIAVRSVEANSAGRLSAEGVAPPTATNLPLPNATPNRQ